MRNINIGYKVTSLLIILLMGVTTSCLKDDGRVDFSDVGYVIEMLDAQAGKAQALSASDANKDGIADDITLMVRVNQTGPDATTHDIVVGLGVNQAGLDLYNTDKSHVPGTMVPDDAVSFPSSVTIVHGLDSLGNKNRTATFPLTIHVSKIPTTPGVNYVVSVGISSTTPATTISGNFGAILYNFYHNPYDGVYSMGGQMFRFNDDGTPANDGLDGAMKAGLTTDVITIGATTSTFAMAWANGGGVGGVGNTATPRITVKADNSVVLDIVDGGATPAAWGPIDGVPSYYDPATKTFHINYKWSTTGDANPSFTGTNRAMEYVLTWVKNR